MPKITEYEPIVGTHTIEELRLLANRLYGKVIQNINSTAVGGGVAEILNRLVPLLRELGVDVKWDVIKGGDDFFQVTKKIPQRSSRKARRNYSSNAGGFFRNKPA